MEVALRQLLIIRSRWTKMKKIQAFILFILFSFNTAFALGSAAGTDITAYGTSINITCKNSFNVQMNEVNGTNILDDTRTVQPMYGFALATYIPYEIAGSRGQTVTYPFSFINKSNVDIRVSPNNSTLFSGNIGSPWSTTLNLGAVTLNVDQTFTNTFSVSITPNAQNNAKAISEIQFNLTNGLYASAYTGFNDQRYGGIGIFDQVVTTTVYTPVVGYIAKTQTLISAPIVSGYRDGDTSYLADPVPGSILEYAIQVRNNSLTGSGIVDIEEEIPSNSIFLNIPGSSDVQENSATLGAANDVDYDTNGTYNLGVPANSYAGRNAVNKIRFRISDIPSGITKTLRYRVTVRN